MATIKFKRGITGPSGLTLAEPAWDYANNKLFLGVTSSAIWVGAEIDNSATLASNSQIKIPTQYAVKTYVDSISGGIGATGPTGSTGPQGLQGPTGPTGEIPTNYVISFNGSTGAVSFVNYVSSINGSTGTVTNVARTNEGNTFSVLQVMSSGFTSAGGLFTRGITFSAMTNSIVFNDTSSSGTRMLHSAPSVAATSKYLEIKSQETGALIDDPASIRLSGGDTDNIPSSIDVIANTVNVNTGSLYSVNFVPTNISFNTGGKFTSNVNLANDEFIRNSTNGSIDLMPNGTGTTHFGMKVDTTSSGSGVKLSTIRANDGSTTVGNFEFTNDVRLNSGLSAGSATFSGVVGANSGLTASKLNVVDQAIIGNILNIPYQAIGNTAQRMNIGVYGTVSETTSSSALIWGNSVAASKQSAQKIEKTTFDTGHFVKMRYDTGISIHTNITGVAGTEYVETQNTRLLVDLNGNVGINTTSPTHKLDVSGNMNVTSGSTFGGLSNFNAGFNSTGATFSGNIYAPNIVTSVNGITGNATISGGTGISITQSGKTLTVTTSFSSTTQTIDFSKDINKIEFDVFTTNTGTFIQAEATRANIENLSGLTATIQRANESVIVIGTVESVNWYTNRNVNTTSPTGYLTIIMKPPFYNYTTPSTKYTAEELLSLSLTKFSGGIGGNPPPTFDSVGITGSISLLHMDSTYCIKSVTGQSWVSSDLFITCKVLGLTTDDHTPEDAILEGVKFEINNIVAGDGFDIMAHAPEGTYGKYKVKCLGQ